MADQGEEHLTAYQVRHRKLQRLREAGIDPFPSSYIKTHTNREAISLWSSQKEFQGGDDQQDRVSVGGRIVAIRTMGKATFIDLQDGSGRLQTLLRQNVLKETYQLIGELDIGDFLGVTGELFETRTGEVTVNAQTLSILSKALHPPPEKWHGLKDTEQRYRHREVDLLSNDEVRQRFKLRSDLVHGIREFLRNRGFIEVETPILLPVAAGAMATPFVTHHNALDRTLYLRIATELHLKRCIIGGLDRVFEIGRLFRNEGLDFRHNPEFTSLESYQAYCNYLEVMEMTEEMVAHLALELLGTTDIPWKGQMINVKPPWERKSVKSAIYEYSGIDIEQFPDAVSLAQRMRDIGLEVTQEVSWGRLVDKLLGDTVEPNQTQPIFLIDYPLEMSPLAKEKIGHPGYVERFEAFIGGMEIANAFSELNDPVEQRFRFEQQEALRDIHENEDFDRLDQEFLTALEFGMPPTGGLGMGIDRLAMLFSNQTSIREVILFPHLSWSQDEITREVDRALRKLSHPSRSKQLTSVESVIAALNSMLPDEVLTRITPEQLENFAAIFQASQGE